MTAPIDTAAIRVRYSAATSDAALGAVLRDVPALCDALDASRATEAGLREWLALAEALAEAAGSVLDTEEPGEDPIDRVVNRHQIEALEAAVIAYDAKKAEPK